MSSQRCAYMRALLHRRNHYTTPVRGSEGISKEIQGFARVSPEGHARMERLECGLTKTSGQKIEVEKVELGGVRTSFFVSRGMHDPVAGANLSSDGLEMNI